MSEFTQDRLDDWEGTMTREQFDVARSIGGEALSGMDDEIDYSAFTISHPTSGVKIA